MKPFFHKINENSLEPTNGKPFQNALDFYFQHLIDFLSRSKFTIYYFIRFPYFTFF